LAHRVGHLFAHLGVLHVADGVRHLLDAGLLHGPPDRIGHLFDAGFLHHAGGGGHHVAADLGAFLEGPAGAFTIVSDALGVHVGATHIAGHRIRDLLLDDLLLHAADRVRHALDLGLFHHPADGVGHLLDDGVGHLLANGVGDLLVDTLL